MDRLRTQSGDQSWEKVALLWRVAGSLVFVSWFFILVIGGFAWPLGLSKLSYWPWTQARFMFITSTNKHYLLQAKGSLVDGSTAFSLVERYFKFPAAFHSTRFNEVSRSDWQLRQIGGYLCRKYNREVPESSRMVTISIWDTWWDNKRGLRRYEYQVPTAEKQTWSYLTNEPCSKLVSSGRK